MKALKFERYGAPEKVLEIKSVDKPIPKDREVLVKIHTTAINDYDWSLVRGKPYLYRLMFGLRKPKHQIPGMELAGSVEETGANVQRFTIGDAVFGDTSQFGFGTFAEYMCIGERALIRKPDALSFEEATSIPHAFTLALQALKDMGQMTKGQKILINGGGGGVGTLGLQLAKLHSCEVTGVDTGEKLEMMKSIGFDHCIDYKKTNFTKNGEKYDLILDCKTSLPAMSYLRSLKTNGKYISIGGKLTSLLGVFFWGKLIPLFSSKRLRILSLIPNKGLDYFVELYEQNNIKSNIDGPYSLEQIPGLIQYFGEGKHKGKIVIKTNA